LKRLNQLAQVVRQNRSVITFYAVTVGVVLMLLWIFQKYQLQIQMLFINQYNRQKFFEDVVTTFGDFMTLTLGILVEALPFVVLGVAISVVIQVVLPTDRLIKKLPRNRLLRRLIMSFLGVLMPVCECGNVPVARGLIVKGFSVQEAIVFLLAAPSINLITFIVTWEAFSFNHSMAIVRVLATLVIANLTAMLVAKLVNRKKLLTASFRATCETDKPASRSLAGAAELFRHEMWLVTRLLVIGAMIAAASQTFIPHETIIAIGSNPILAVAAMLLLAFVISICSSVDAFFALSYVNVFGLGSLLAFLVAGPMVDIKMLALMKTTFSARVLVVITASVAVCSLITGVVFSYVW
jgi:uncharacterized membrane protein YraQ (UPF0718 family)